MKLEFKLFRLANVTYKTRDKGQQEKCHVVAVIRKLRTDKNCPAAKSLPLACYEWQIRSKKTYGPNNNGQSKHNDAKDRTRKCCRFPKILSFTTDSK